MSAPRLPLLMVHGWGMAPAHWAPLQERLEDQYPVTCPALPGHGAASPQPDWRPEALADQWVERFPDRIWIGWSLGGLVALAAALRHPKRVRGLILVGATPCFVNREDWTHGMAIEQFQSFRAECLVDPRGTLILFTALQMQADSKGRAGLRALRDQAATAEAPDPEGLQQGLDVLEETDFRAHMDAIACPTLWLTGEGDTLTPPVAAAWAASRQPTARVVTLEGAGHAPFITQPSTLSEHIHAWLREQDAP